MALGPTIEVGILAAEPTQYDSAHWWRTSDGAKTVVAETMGYFWAKLFFRPREGRRVHVHVRAVGGANERFALLFRDYLRAHSSAAQAYGRLKLQLARELADPAAYPDVKDPACDLIWIAAEEWAASIGWTL